MIWDFGGWDYCYLKIELGGWDRIRGSELGGYSNSKGRVESFLLLL